MKIFTMKCIFTSLLILVFSFCSRGQLTKGNWLVGGNANFSSTKIESISSVGTQKSTYTDISISPDMGYFILDKFAGGIKVSFTNDKFNGGDLISGGVQVASGGHSNITWFDIGPFLRYYFLPVDNQTNLFTEVNYSYGTANTHPGKGSRYSYSFHAGPVVYFNTSVGIEFTIGYNFLKSTFNGPTSSNDDYTNKNNAFQIGIGFQIHLEK